MSFMCPPSEWRSSFQVGIRARRIAARSRPLTYSTSETLLPRKEDRKCCTNIHQRVVEQKSWSWIVLLRSLTKRTDFRALRLQGQKLPSRSKPGFILKKKELDSP